MVALALPALHPAPDLGRQPQRPVRHAGDDRSAPARGAHRTRARSRRSRWSSKPALRAARSAPDTVAAERRLVAELRTDPRVVASTIQAPSLGTVAMARQASLLDPSRSGAADARCGAHRLRHAARRSRWCTPSATTTSRTRASRRADRVLPHRRPGLRRRFHGQGLRRLPVARGRGARDHLLRAPAGLPLRRAAAEGRALEPALRERRLRRPRAHLPARRRQLARLRAIPSDRSVDPDLPVRDHLRHLDGLRGLHALAHARGLGRTPRQRIRRGVRPRAHRVASSRRPRSS